jgi:peptidylprolyl isomerase
MAVTDRVTSPKRATNRPGAGQRPTKTKAEKRAEAKAAKARALAAKKRRQAMAGFGAAVIVVLLVIGGFLLFGRSKHTTSSTAGASSTPAAVSSAFPPVPAGADPALKTKPTAAAGTGSVTKLGVTTLIAGTGPATQSGQTISVNYVGATYADGKEFDSSWSRSQAFSFQLGAGKVIPGWDQGLVGVKVGSRVQLDIPSNLAYGDNPGNGAPGGALRFIVDVLSAS